jgi:NAD-dependent DNA ligase
MKILAPTQCPSCGSTLSRVKAQLFCLNSKECLAQSSKKLQNFCKKLKIKGFGESTVEKLKLTNFNDLIKLTAEYAESCGLSNHMSLKLVEVIKQRLKLGVSPNDFLAACSIPLIGDGAMRKLKFDFIANITSEMCKKQGLGNIAASNLLSWIDTEWCEYQEFWETYFVENISKATPTNTVLPVVCITGKLTDYANRTAAGDYLSSLGFQVKSTVTKQVQYLICEDGNTSSSSYKKAIGYGLTVTTIKILEEKYDKQD